MVGATVTSRELILGRLRAALGPPPNAPGEVARDYRPAGGAVHLDVLVHRLTDYGQRCTGAPTTRWRTSSTRFSADDGSSSRRGCPGTGCPTPSRRSPTTISRPNEIATADGVVTAAAVAVAETGTVILDAAADQGRRIITLLPDVHICVLRVDQIAAGVPDALARLGPRRPLTWISGPSATSDIELNRVEGVHGPRNLHLVIVPRGSHHSLDPVGDPHSLPQA